MAECALLVLLEQIALLKELLRSSSTSWDFVLFGKSSGRKASNLFIVRFYSHLTITEVAGGRADRDAGKCLRNVSCRIQTVQISTGIVKNLP